MIVILYNSLDSIQPWFNCFDLAMNSISLCFKNNNIDNIIVKNIDYEINKNDIILLFSPWFNLINNENRFILINSESMHVARNFHLINNFYKKNIIFWFDYSLKNVNLLKNINLKKVFHLPISYSVSLENKICKNNDKSIDILFYGYLNERRLHIKEQLEKYNLNILFCSSFDNPIKLYETISKSKIILIIHFYEESYCINHYRINILLSNKIFIIHEIVEKEEEYLDYNDNIIFSEYDEIVKNCIKYLNLTQNDRDKISNNIYNWYSTQHNIEKNIPYSRIKDL